MPRQPLVHLAAALAIVLGAGSAVAAPARTTADFQLIEAAYSGKLPQVRALLAQGAAVDAQDEYGYTALHWAAQAGWPLTTKALIDAGASVDARDASGRTPLLLATVRKHVEVARVLVTAGADPNAKDTQGNAPLEYARRKGMPQLSTLLAEAAANPRLPERPSIVRPLPGMTPRPTAHATPRPAAHATPHATPHVTAHATPKPVAHATPHATAHATPKPVAHATPHATAHATPKPVIHAPATPKPVAHATPHVTAHATPAPHPTTVVAAGTGPVALSAHFREEVARLYGLYTDHIGMRDPENLNQAGFNQKLEDQVEKIFHTLDYGSAATLPREKLHDARAWIIAARKDAGGDDRVCSQTLESLDQLLSGVGF